MSGPRQVWTPSELPEALRQLREKEIRLEKFVLRTKDSLCIYPYIL